MAKDEKTGKGPGSTASKGLRTGKLSKPETRSVSGSTLTQRPNKPSGGKGKGKG